MPPRNTSSTPADHLTPDEARAEHEALGAEIAEHDRRYYEEDAPTGADEIPNDLFLVELFTAF